MPGLSMIGKFSALFTSLLDPVLRTLFCILSGMMEIVDLSNLKVISWNSSWNLFVLRLSIFFALFLPSYFRQNTLVNGIMATDQILHDLLITRMFIGGCVAFILNNTISSTP